MSGSGDRNPRGRDPYADPIQEHVPGQRQDGAGSQAGWADNGYGRGAGAPPTRPGYAGPTAYLAGAPVGLAGAVRGAFGNVFTYQGRASRSAFWWFTLVAIIVYAIVSAISDYSRTAGIILDIVVGIPFLLANISLAVRRLHDSNHSGWWWWIGFVPLVGWIVNLIFYLLPSTPGPNRYNAPR